MLRGNDGKLARAIVWKRSKSTPVSYTDKECGEVRRAKQGGLLHGASKNNCHCHNNKQNVVHNFPEATATTKTSKYVPCFFPPSSSIVECSLRCSRRTPALLLARCHRRASPSTNPPGIVASQTPLVDELTLTSLYVVERYPLEIDHNLADRVHVRSLVVGAMGIR